MAFERYADDAVIHCVSEYQARKVLAALREQMAGVGLELHPDKTRIVYARTATGAVKDALKKISAEVRSWRLHRHMELDSAGIARWINPVVRG